ncbi:MAG: hypothetical protein MHM6MM_004723 [Cercozoa sp. M6MM]
MVDGLGDTRAKRDKGKELDTNDDNDKWYCRYWLKAANLPNRFLALLPLKDDIARVNSRFGAGIAQFFAFYRFVVLCMLLMTLVWLPHLIQVASSVGWGRFLAPAMFSSQGGNSVVPVGSLISTHPSDLSVGFVVSLCVAFVVLLLLALTRLINDATRRRRKEAMTALSGGEDVTVLSRSTLAPWDFGASFDARTAQENRLALSEQINAHLFRLQLEARLALRTKAQWTKLWIRRIVGVLVNTAILFSACFAIVWLATNKDTVRESLANSSFDFGAELAAPFATAALGVLLPSIVLVIVNAERWDTEALRLKHLTWRLFLARQVAVMVNVLALLAVARGQSVLNLNLDSSYDTNEFLCAEDAAAAGLLYLVLAEFFVSKAAKIGVYSVKSALAQCVTKACFNNNDINRRRVHPKGRQMTPKSPSRFVSILLILFRHATWRASDAGNELLVFTSLAFAATPMSPLASLIAGPLLLFNFKFERGTVIEKLRGKPQSAVGTGGFLDSFFVKFYVVTLGMFGFVALLTLFSSLPCKDIDGVPQGLFKDTRDYMPWFILTDEVFQQGGGTSTGTWILEVLATPLLPTAIALFAVTRWRISRSDARFRAALAISTLAKHNRDVDALRRTVQRQEAMLRVQRNQQTY